MEQLFLKNYFNFKKAFCYSVTNTRDYLQNQFTLSLNWDKVDQNSANVYFHRSAKPVKNHVKEML